MPLPDELNDPWARALEHSAQGNAAMRDATPILPAHIEDTIRAISELHAQQQRNATPTQKAVARMTAFVARPRFVGLMTVVVLAWLVANSVLHFTGRTPFDPAPFAYLEDIGELLGLYITVLILIAQRHDDQLAGAREQLTLELAILSEQKNAKIIALLEEMRRDNPLLRNRVDEEAEALSVPADPQAVLDALQETQTELETSVGETGEGSLRDPPPPLA